MKRIILFITVLALSFGVKGQTQHIDGQTKLINPTGTTLLLERDNDDSWLTFHDPEDYWYSMGIDNSNSGSFSLNTGGKLNSSQFVMSANGNVGIGTTNSSVKLHVEGSATNGEIGTEEIFKLGRPVTSGASFQQAASFKLGRWAPPTSNFESFTRLDIALKDNTTSSNYNTDITVMTLQNNGYVGIGTTNPDMKLTVKGNIHAEEIKIDLFETVPDFVFKDNYNLRSIDEVEKFINENGHLPEIPSAQEFKKNGMMLAKMDMDLLKKIEELTLYIIEQEKSIKEQAEEIDLLKGLTERLAKIEKQLKQKE